jgi:C_GCAxxG_C_C family probable redox protein
MKIENVSENFTKECFVQGIDCSQIVLGYAADKAGINSDEALRISSAFGGGMWAGRACGCVTGALMALGLKYGHSKPGETERKNTMLAKKNEFEQKFTAEYKSVVCKDILGYDLSIPEEMNRIMEKNLLFTLCPKVVCSACKMLDELL